MENEINLEDENPVKEFFEKLQNLEKSNCNEAEFEKLTNKLHEFIDSNKAALILLAPLCFVRKERKSFKNTKEGIDEILKNNFTKKNINNILYQSYNDIISALNDDELMFRIHRLYSISKIKKSFKDETSEILKDITLIREAISLNRASISDIDHALKILEYNLIITLDKY